MTARGFVLSVRRILLVASLVAAALWACLPAAAHASATQESTFQDDNLIVYGSPQVVTQTLSRLKALGVDRIRVSVFWKLVAPSPDSPAKPAFNAADPAEYPPGAWDRYDRIVRLAAKLGLGVNFNVTSPAPNWATGTPERSDIDETYDPDPREFYAFMVALGRRYSGSYYVGGPPPSPSPVPGGPPVALQSQAPQGTPLPRVDYWTIWNEPNQSGWLTPQWAPDSRKPRSLIEASPRIYRGLVDAAWVALQGTYHNTDTILIGETAPKGIPKPPFSDVRAITRSMDPLRFIHRLYCLDDNLQFLQGSEAQVNGCPTGNQAFSFPDAHPGLFKMTGYAHHPYELTFAPNRKPLYPRRWVTIANLRDLTRTMVRIFQRYGQPLPGGGPTMPLYLTEFGYQTNPPDPLGVSMRKQAAYLNQSEFIAYRNPGVRTLAQFLLVDDKPVKNAPPSERWSTFQSGIIQLNGHHKPSFRAYELPLYLPKAHLRPGQKARIWGLVRMAPNGASQPVAIELRGLKSRKYRRLATRLTAPGPGYLDTMLRLPHSGYVRLAWPAPGGRVYHSRSVRVWVGARSTRR
jgi:hypothetical protein